MQYCSADLELCALSYFFGGVSLIYFLICSWLLLKYIHRKEKKVLIFYIVTLIPMTLHYFFTETEFNYIFFAKEYFQMITSAYIVYYYLHQLYMLYEKHNFLTSFGLGAIIATLIYVLLVGGYFVVAAIIMGQEIFYCSNPEWLMITAAVFIFSIIFLSIGLVVNRDLNSREILYRDEVLKKMKDLWVLIIIYITCSVVKLITFAVYMVLQTKQCIIDIAENIEATLILFIICRGITDYPLVSIIFYQFFKDAKKLKIRSPSLSDCSEVIIENLIHLKPHTLSEDKFSNNYISY